MKLSTLLLAILLTLGWITTSPAQLIVSQSIPNTGSFIVTLNVTLTKSGPIDVMVVTTGGTGGSIFIDGTNVGSIYESSFIASGATTSGTLAPGVHTVTLSVGFTGGGITVIAPNEPPSGDQAAITSLD